MAERQWTFEGFTGDQLREAVDYAWVHGWDGGKEMFLGDRRGSERNAFWVVTSVGG